MTDALRVTVIVYALGLAAICAATALRGRRRASSTTAALGILQAGVMVQAVIDLVAVARGRHGDGLAVHVAYLVSSLLILPVFVASVRFDQGRWGNIALATGCAVLAVVCLRLDQTLGRP